MINTGVHIFKFSCTALVFISSLCAHAQTENTKFFYDNGKLSSEGPMEDGKPNGYWKTYFETGVLKSEGNRELFELDSIWKFYSEDGLLTQMISYQADKKNGETLIFNEFEDLSEKVNYRNGLKDGLEIKFFPTGEKQSETPYVLGKAKGKGFEYAQDGRVITLLTYDEGYVRSMTYINRYNRQGNKKGIWQDYHSNGKVKVEGNYDNGLKNGVFKYYDARGKLQKIEKYLAGELLTEAEEAALLTIGKEYYDNGGLKQVGSFRNGKKDGIFRSYDELGNITGATVFEGNRKVGEGTVDSNGQRSGMWKLFFQSGELRAEGEYEQGLRTGPWSFFFASGKVEQKGSYKEDMPAGLWKWYFSDGNLEREESFRRGKEDGAIVEYNEEGQLIVEGEYIDGYESGNWVVTIGDHKEEGEYVDGDKHGQWIHTYDNDQKQFVGTFELGIPVGKHKYYYRNGKMQEEGKYQGGEKNGDWKYYNQDGEQIVVIEFKDGEEFKIDGVRIPRESDLN